MKKTSFIIMVIILFVFILFSLKDIFLESDNPLKMSLAIIKLEVSNSEIEKVSEKKYVAKSKIGKEKFLQLMKKQGWLFQEQIGGGLIFEKDGEITIVTERNFSRYFITLSVGESRKKTQ